MERKRIALSDIITTPTIQYQHNCNIQMNWKNLKLNPPEEDATVLLWHRWCSLDCAQVYNYQADDSLLTSDRETINTSDLSDDYRYIILEEIK
jgi:hypothetical protein